MSVRNAKAENILWEGPAAYAVSNGDGTCECVVYSSNCVTHITAARSMKADRAEIWCRRANAYPRNIRASYGLN